MIYLFETEKGMNLYKKCITNLKEETKEYFRLLFLQKKSDYVYQKLFTHKYRNSKIWQEKFYQNFSFYTEEEFYTLKKQLLKAVITFKNIDILNLQNILTLDKEFDFIYLSNIPLFLNITPNYFKDTIIPNLKNKLTKEGILIFHYLHEYLKPFKNDITHKEKAYQALNDKLYSAFKCENLIEIHLTASGYGHGLGTKDLAIGLKK